MNKSGRNRPDLEDHVPAGIDRTDALLDEALRETFPASDPTAVSSKRQRHAEAGGTLGSTGSTLASSHAAAAVDINATGAAVDVNAAGAAVAVDGTPMEATIYGSEGVLVEQLLPAARARLVTITDDAPLIEAAKLLRAGTDLVVVCSSGGVVTGVITKTDVVGRISDCQGGACLTAASLVMTRSPVRCGPRDLLHAVWATMKSRSLKNLPITDPAGRPVGVLNARDALGALLQGVEDEESLLRDYVMGVGYR